MAEAGKSKAEAQRVALTPHTSAEEFRDFYWLKSELQAFCRAQQLSTTGGKRELAERIAQFLATGTRLASARAPAAASASERDGARLFNASSAADFTMHTRIPAGFRCTQALRAFFEMHVDPTFRFTVTLQRYIKEHPGISFEQLAAYWREESAARKAGVLQPIAPQFEYNQFTRDFYADPINRGKPRTACIEAWKRTRAARGDNQYRRSR